MKPSHSKPSTNGMLQSEIMWVCVTVTKTDSDTASLTTDFSPETNASMGNAFAHVGSHRKPPRTAGLRIFDALLYPFLTNFGVFGLSVVATYLTNKGGDRTGEGKLIYGKIGHFFFKRGEFVKSGLKKIGFGESAADMAKMVFFSFADGTVFAPLVKLCEDRREKIAMWIDRRLGTVPTDQSVYDAEPKETWGSVLEGRLLTSLIVVPTAVALTKTGLNAKLFDQPGEALGHKVKEHPTLIRFFERFKVHKQNIPEVFRIGAFEAVYTSICTAGLYFISRVIARKHSPVLTPSTSVIARENNPDVFSVDEPASPPAKLVSNAEALPITKVASIMPQGMVASDARGLAAAG